MDKKLLSGGVTDSLLHLFSQFTMYEFINESIVQPQSLKDSNRVTRCTVNGSCKILQCRSKFVKSAFSIKGWNTLPTKIQHRDEKHQSFFLCSHCASQSDQLMALCSSRCQWYTCMTPEVKLFTALK